MESCCATGAAERRASHANLRPLTTEGSSAGFVLDPIQEEGRRDRTYACVAVFIGLTVLGWALFNLTVDRHGIASHREQDFCCPRLIATLAEVTNTSIAPCSSFHNFACFRRGGIEQLDITFKSLLGDVVSPALHGTARDPASEVLYIFHSSCTRTAVDTGFTLLEAVRNFVGALRVRLPMPHADMLTLLGSLHLGYGFMVAVNTSFISKKDRWLAILFVTAPDARSVNEYNIELLLRAFNALLNSTTTLKDVMELHEELAKSANPAHPATTDWDRGARRLSSSDNEVNSAVIMKYWKPLLVSAGVLERESPFKVNISDAAARVLGTLIAPERRPVAVAYVVLKSAEALYEMEFLSADHPPESPENARYCEDKTESLRTLWAMVMYERLKSSRRNVYLSQVFSLVRSVIIDQVKRIVVFNRDVTKVKYMLEGLQQMSFVEAMEDMSAEKLPDVTPMYWSNCLAVRAHTQRLALKLALMEPGEWWTLQGNCLYDVRASVHGRTLFVSGALYSKLPKGNDTDVFVNAALIGANVANAIWREVFALGNLSEEGRARLQRVKTCAVNRLGQKATGLEHALLSISSAVDAAKGSDWYDRVVSWGNAKLSVGQIFYMVYFISNICASRCHTMTHNVTLSLGHWYMRRLPDFIAAFECKPLSPLLDDACFLVEASF